MTTLEVDYSTEMRGMREVRGHLKILGRWTPSAYYGALPFGRILLSVL